MRRRTKLWTVIESAIDANYGARGPNGRFWHEAPVRCNAPIRSLLDGKRTWRPRREWVDPARLTPTRSAPGSWQRTGGVSPPRGRFSQPPRPQVMHEVLLARAAVKRSQGRPRAKY